MELSRFVRRLPGPSSASPLSPESAAVTPDHHEAEAEAELPVPDAGGEPQEALLMPVLVLVLVFVAATPWVGEAGGEGMPFAAPAEAAGAGTLEAKEDVCVVFSVCVCVALRCLSRSVHRSRILPCRENQSCYGVQSRQPIAKETIRRQRRSNNVGQTRKQTEKQEHRCSSAPMFMSNPYTTALPLLSATPCCQRPLFPAN